MVDLTEPEKKRRGRPPKSEVTKAQGGNTPPRSTKATSKGIKPADVKKGVKLLFSLAAMTRGPHWVASDQEIDPWAADAAELLDRIPAPVVAGALNLSSGIAVAVGLGTMVSRRLAFEASMRQQAMMQNPEPPAASNGHAPADDGAWLGALGGM